MRRAHTYTHVHTDVRPIFTEITSIEGLAYDWIAKNIYWTDNIRNSLEVVRYNGEHRKVIIPDDGTLDRPRGIAVDPQRGYVTTDCTRVQGSPQARFKA